MNEQNDQWGLQEIIKNQTAEIERLRKELNNALSAVHWRDIELDRLRQRVAELEEQKGKMRGWIDMADSIIRERGEKMKEMRRDFAEATRITEPYYKWFDETGDPL